MYLVFLFQVHNNLHLIPHVLGTPYVPIGHSKYYASGITLSYCDVSDVYVEEFDVKDTTKYKFKDEWKTATVVEEKFNVKDKGVHTEKIRITHHGPIISDCIIPFVSFTSTVNNMPVQNKW